MWTVPIVALVLAGFLEATRWGQGSLNWGPRAGSLFLLVFGDVAFRGTFAGDWLTRGVTYLAHWANMIVAWAFGATAGNVTGALVSWLPAALVGAYWVVAWSPWGGERMTWRLAWVGMLLPTFMAQVPGFAGGILTTIINFAISVGAAIVGGLFSAKGAVIH